MRTPNPFRSVGLATAIALLALAPGAGAMSTVVVGFDGATPSQRQDFRTAPFTEYVTRASVAGHYEIVADAHGTAGDFAMNVDDENTGNATLTIQVIGGLPFDAVQLDVVNPADGAFTISAVGGAGSFSPTTIGAQPFPAGFQNITALVVTQSAPGAFAFDDLELSVLPEPAALPALAAAALLLGALRRRRP